ncbi:MAG: mycofactocin precursor MftA [Deltaproteobacteria bacterium]|nr:mycofactocin precursor MftA [Deltaproteobacteria bacterium]
MAEPIISDLAQRTRVSKSNQNNESEDQKDNQTGRKEKDLFATEQIEIEEMAIDGICGVY